MFHLLTIVFALALTPKVWAHPLQLSYLEIQAEGEIWQARFAANPTTLKAWLGLAPEASETELPLAKLYEVLFAESSLKDQVSSHSELKIIDETSWEVHWRIPAPPASSEALTFWIKSWPPPPDFQIFATLFRPHSQETFVFNAAHPHWRESLDSPGRWSFFISGLEHIGAWPNQWWTESGWRWPEGMDHILYTATLALATQSPTQALALITGFTVGHSLTLALSLWNVLPRSTRIIEPLIALTLVINSFLLLRRSTRWKISWPLTSFFGLIHGLGFASALSSLALDPQTRWQALALFNLGIEAGQVVILLVVFAGIGILNQFSLQGRWRPWPALAILVLSSFWLVERLVQS